MCSPASHLFYAGFLGQDSSVPAAGPCNDRRGDAETTAGTSPQLLLGQEPLLFERWSARSKHSTISRCYKTSYSTKRYTQHQSPRRLDRKTPHPKALDPLSHVEPLEPFNLKEPYRILIAVTPPTLKPGTPMVLDAETLDREPGNTKSVQNPKPCTLPVTPNPTK